MIRKELLKGSLLRIGNPVRVTQRCTIPHLRGERGRVVSRKPGARGGYWIYQVRPFVKRRRTASLLGLYRRSLKKITEGEVALWKLRQ